jgi:hypothetical protein
VPGPFGNNILHLQISDGAGIQFMMKTLILSLTVFAFVAVAQADDSAKATKTATTKAATSEKAKMTCDAKEAKEKSCCSSCCDKAPQKQALMSPKAAAERRL